MAKLGYTGTAEKYLRVIDGGANASPSQLNRALAFAGAGVPVFPCRAQEELDPWTGKIRKEKTPRTANGFNGATTNEDLIRLWWRDKPDDLIGIPTGKVTGIAVLDLDRKDGRDGFVAIRAVCSGLPRTLTNATPSGGEHWIYAYPEGEGDIACATGAFKTLLGLKETGIDTRADGGYIIAWGNLSPRDLMGLPAWPEAITDAFAREKEAKAAQRNANAVRVETPSTADPAADPRSAADKHRMRASGIAALEGRAKDLAAEPKGGRSKALFDAVCRVGRWKHHGYLSEEAIRAALLDACQQNGFIRERGADEFERVLKNGLKYSENDPAPDLKERPRSPQNHTGSDGYSSPAPGEAKEQPEDHFRPVRLGNLLRKPAPPRRWRVPEWIPAGQVTLLSGDGGIGKSMLTLQLAAAVATGTPWLGMPVKQGRVAVLSAEDDMDEMHFRFECIIRGLEGEHETKLEALNDVWLIDGSKDLDPTLASFDEKNKRLLFTDTLAKLQAFVIKNAINVLILDSAADVFSEEINRYGVRSFIRLIRGLADTVVLLGHPSVAGMKDGRGYSGSTHWNNAVRSRLVFTRAADAGGNEPDPDLRFLEVAKSNRSKAKQKLPLRWTETGFVRDEKAASGLDKLARQLKAEEVFLRLTRLFNEQGRPISPNSSRSGAPVLFANHPDGEGYTKADFERAMEILLSAGKLEIIPEGPPSKLVRRLRVKEA